MLLIITDQTRIDNLPEELQSLYKAYLRMLDKRTEFDKIKREYRCGKINKERFDHLCKFLCSFIKYISYRKDKELFEVRPRIAHKKYTFIGAFKSLDEASEMLSDYLKLKIQ